MITNFDERIKFIDYIFPLLSIYFVNIFVFDFFPKSIKVASSYYMNYDFMSIIFCCHIIVHCY